MRKMAFAAAKLCPSFRVPHRLLLFYSFHSPTSQQVLRESLMAAVKSKTYQKIPELLDSAKYSLQNANNPFGFLSSVSESNRVHIIDEILQSFIPIRPRSLTRVAYSCLLSYSLQIPNPLPLALAILQRTLRSGCLPVSQTHLLLANAWVHRRNRFQSVSSILLEMDSIRYSPDSGTCNYLILSLCKVDKFDEAMEVLRGMARAGCIPDLDSYGNLIGEMSELRMTSHVVEMVKEMVSVRRLSPRQVTVLKAVDAMCANKIIRTAVEMIEHLEHEGIYIRFETYESVLEGCLENKQFVLAAKVAVGMTGKGFIPYIKVRQRVVDGLASIGDAELASTVRQRFGELKS